MCHITRWNMSQWNKFYFGGRKLFINTIWDNSEEYKYKLYNTILQRLWRDLTKKFRKRKGFKLLFSLYYVNYNQMWSIVEVALTSLSTVLVYSCLSKSDSILAHIKLSIVRTNENISQYPDRAHGGRNVKPHESWRKWKGKSAIIIMTGYLIGRWSCQTERSSCCNHQAGGQRMLRLSA